MQKYKIILLQIICCGVFCIGSFPERGYSQATQKKPDQVWKLNIEGNQTFSDIIIKDQIVTSGFSFWEKLKFWSHSGHKLNIIDVKKDAIRIRNYYNRRGFYAASVRYRIEDGSKPHRKIVTFIVNEKPPIRITNIHFAFGNDDTYRNEILENNDFKKVRRKSEYQIGTRYGIIKKPEVSSSYEQVIKNLGFAYAKVDIKARVDTTQLAADLTIECSLGPKTYIDDVKVEGEKTISKRYVLRETGLKKKELFSLDALQEAQRELFNHHLFRFATINIPDQKRDSSLTLELRVRENPLHTVQTSIGFGTQDYLRGRISWINRNAFGRGHKFTVTAKASFIEQSLNLDYLFPYVFNTKSSFVISPFGQHLLEPSYELSRFGITNSFIYRYNQHTTGSVSYQLTRNAELSQQLDASLPDTAQQYNLSSLQFSGYYNQGFSRGQQRGWVIEPYVELSGLLGSASFQFQKLSLDVRRYTPITRTTTLATRVQGGILFGAKNDSLPNNIRYFLGGTNSVRGYGREELGPKLAVTDSVRDGNGNVIADSTRFVRYIPVGGRASFSFNIEIRQNINKIIKNFGLAAFLDGGQVWRDGPDFGHRPLQFTTGGGVRYSSPIGPVRLDVGYKLNPSPADLDIYHGQDYGNFWNHIGIHLSIGQAF